MRIRRTLVVLAVISGLSCAAAFATPIRIKGNSNDGIGTGANSWNITSLLGTTSLLNYNTAGSYSSAEVFSLGGGAYEQIACSSRALCDLGDTTTPLDFLFQVPITQIHNGVITFTNFTGAISDITTFAYACDGGQFQGPGFLCTTYPNGYGNLSIDATLNGTTLTFALSGYQGLSSITLILQEANNSGTLNGPRLATVPEPTSMLLMGSGLLAIAARRRKMKQGTTGLDLPQNKQSG